MSAAPNQHRMASVLTRVASGFSTFILAVILSTQYNSMGPNISPRDLDSKLLSVVVAKVAIPVGSRIIAEQIEINQFPADATPEGAISQIDENLVDRVVTTPISPKEPITEAKLAPVGSVSGLASVIPEGYRAMTLKVDDVVGVSGFIMPGTLVDIVVVIQPPKGNADEDVISKIVLQNIKVLASGQNIDKPRNEKEVERVKRAVTLQVTPPQAERLALASSEGKLQLVVTPRMTNFK